MSPYSFAVLKTVYTIVMHNNTFELTFNTYDIYSSWIYLLPRQLCA